LEGCCSTIELHPRHNRSPPKLSAAQRKALFLAIRHAEVNSAGGVGALIPSPSPKEEAGGAAPLLAGRIKCDNDDSLAQRVSLLPLYRRLFTP
jgi:hypothetical protein